MLSAVMCHNKPSRGVSDCFYFTSGGRGHTLEPLKCCLQYKNKKNKMIRFHFLKLQSSKKLLQAITNNTLFEK